MIQLVSSSNNVHTNIPNKLYVEGGSEFSFERNSFVMKSRAMMPLTKLNTDLSRELGPSISTPKFTGIAQAINFIAKQVTVPNEVSFGNLHSLHKEETLSLSSETIKGLREDMSEKSIHLTMATKNSKIPINKEWNEWEEMVNEVKDIKDSIKSSVSTANTLKQFSEDTVFHLISIGLYYTKV